MPSRAKLNQPENPSYEEWDDLLGSADRKKIGHNTYAARKPATMSSPAEIAIVLHFTEIVRFCSNGTIHLSTGGYNTVTTRSRMNAVLPRRYSVSQRDFKLYLTDRVAGTEHEFGNTATIFSAVTA